jgi:L-alanine-DL-glutamate epimerase-like enolase superfamily enzyme
MRVGVIDGTVANSVRRVKAAREAIGPDVGLMCDAHGTYTVSRRRSSSAGWSRIAISHGSKSP